MVKYLSLKIARHGAAISRLRWDVRHESGEIGQLPEDHDRRAVAIASTLR